MGVGKTYGVYWDSGDVWAVSSETAECFFFLIFIYILQVFFASLKRVTFFVVTKKVTKENTPRCWCDLVSFQRFCECPILIRIPAQQNRARRGPGQLLDRWSHLLHGSLWILLFWLKTSENSHTSTWGTKPHDFFFFSVYENPRHSRGDGNPLVPTLKQPYKQINKEKPTKYDNTLRVLSISTP